MFLFTCAPVTAGARDTEITIRSGAHLSCCFATRRSIDYRAIAWCSHSTHEESACASPNPTNPKIALDLTVDTKLFGTPQHCTSAFYILIWECNSVSGAPSNEPLDVVPRYSSWSADRHLLFLTTNPEPESQEADEFCATARVRKPTHS